MVDEGALLLFAAHCARATVHCACGCGLLLAVPRACTGSIALFSKAFFKFFFFLRLLPTSAEVDPILAELRECAALICIYRFLLVFGKFFKIEPPKIAVSPFLAVGF